MDIRDPRTLLYVTRVRLHAELLNLELQRRHNCSPEEALGRAAVYVKAKFPNCDDIVDREMQTDPMKVFMLAVVKIGFDTDPTTGDEILSEAELV